MVLVFMVARFVRKWYEWHEVMMAASEWLLTTIFCYLGLMFYNLGFIFYILVACPIIRV